MQAKTFEKGNFVISPAQCRAARALLDWTQNELAKRSPVSAVSIRAFEKGGDMRKSNRRSLAEVFEAAGVTFLADGEEKAGGPGVRLSAL